MACSIREAIKIVQKIRGIHIDVEKVYDLDEFWLICVDRSYRFDPNDVLSGGGLAENLIGWYTRTLGNVKYMTLHASMMWQYSFIPIIRPSQSIRAFGLNDGGDYEA